MNTKEQKKRLFLAYSVEAPWPSKFPAGRVLREEDRHMTLAYLGPLYYSKLEPLLSDLPRPKFPLTPCVHCTDFLLLPPRHPTVVAWHATQIEKRAAVEEYTDSLNRFLEGHGVYQAPDREWLPHITLCRHPRSIDEWRDVFVPLAALLTGFHLYESLGYSRYQKLWGLHFHRAFEIHETEELPRLTIRGTDIADVYLHAQVGLSSLYPELYPHFDHLQRPENEAELLEALGEFARRAGKQSVSIEERKGESDRFLEYQLLLLR